MPAMPDPGRDVGVMTKRGSVELQHLARTGDRGYARLTVETMDGKRFVKRIAAPSRFYYQVLSEIARVAWQ